MAKWLEAAGRTAVVKKKEFRPAGLGRTFAAPIW